MTIGPDEFIKKVVVDFGDREWAPGLLYVALTRVVSSDCMAIDPVTIDECMQFVHQHFYDSARFEKMVNNSKMSHKILAFLDELKARSASNL